MKAKVALLLAVTAVCVLLCGCSGKGTAHLRVFIPDSETGVSGTVYDGDFSFSGGTTTVDYMLYTLASKGSFEYVFDGSMPSINGLEMYENLDELYIRAWTVTVNGVYDESCMFAKVRDGDNVEVVYEFMDLVPDYD
ncbi:MAG: hypothetical protein IJK33_07115 [Clostridia bacterium]|nr:hypothetical protein [Clostridia bacterium]MBQ6183640.1 hypothetical protein [Clostridia bacterium]